jgi:hypothetical protein
MDAKETTADRMQTSILRNLAGIESHNSPVEKVDAQGVLHQRHSLRAGAAEPEVFEPPRRGGDGPCRTFGGAEEEYPAVPQIVQRLATFGIRAIAHHEDALL